MRPLSFGTIRNLLLVGVLTGYASTAAATVSFTLAGFRQNSTLGTQEISSGTASGTVAFDLGSHFRIGLTHRQKVDLTEDTKKQTADSESYSFYSSKMLQKSNAVDLTLILYQGEVVMPYIKAGMVVKSYDIRTTVDDQVTATKLTLPPEPSGGIGVGFRLTQNFSLKISYTVSPGVKELPDGTREGVLDSYSEVGVTYEL
jgi:hypothetical protein